MRFREYPLLNTPNMVVIILREAREGPATLDDLRRPAAGAARPGGRAPALRAGGRGEPAGDADPLPERGEAPGARPGRRLHADRARPGGAGRASRRASIPPTSWSTRSSPATSAASSCAAGRSTPRAGGYDQGFYAYWTGDDTGGQSLLARTAPTTSPGRTAGRRRSTRTSAGPARASRRSPDGGTPVADGQRADRLPSGRGRSSGAGSPSASPSQSGQSAGGRITGIRSCTAATSALGAQVTVARLATSAPPGACQRSQTAAKARTARPGARIAQRVLRRRSPVHSNQPLDRHQAAARSGKGRLGEERLGAGVDDRLEHRAAARVGPAHRDQPPAHRRPAGGGRRR